MEHDMNKITLIITALLGTASAGVARLWPWPDAHGSEPMPAIVVARPDLAEVVWAPGDFTGPLIAIPGDDSESMFEDDGPIQWDPAIMTQDD
jgi:hypothetical protein